MTKGETLYQVTAQYFCAGFAVRSGQVIDAAPIIKYFIGWTEQKAKSYCIRKKWAFRPVNPFRGNIDQ